MTDTLRRLEDIIGRERLQEITAQEPGEDDNQNLGLVNAREILCECNTLILRPNHARLIVPSKAMIEIEKHLLCLKPGDEFFKNLVRGCYWLVDDMYKFEQIGYTKEISSAAKQDQTKIEATRQKDGNNCQQTQTSEQANDSSTTKNIATTHPGLRYLACAECNLCPLGWFDPSTKESYLYVW